MGQFLREDDVLCFVDFETTGLTEKDWPIEVACIWADPALEELQAYESLINWPWLPANGWALEHERAYRVHGIDVDILRDKGKHPGVVVDDMVRLTEHWRAEGARVILCSDNAVFEYRFMKGLFENTGRSGHWPFHYAVWDTNLLLEASAIGDVVGKSHRAMDDVRQLVDQLRRIWPDVRRLSCYSLPTRSVRCGIEETDDG